MWSIDRNAENRLGQPRMPSFFVIPAVSFTSQLVNLPSPVGTTDLPAVRTSWRQWIMINRETGFCSNCNSNVVHVRIFKSRFTYWIDRLTFSFLAMLGIGPWQCVDCGTRNFLLPAKKEDAQRKISEKEEQPKPDMAVGNFIRTEHSLAHAVSDESRFSIKYRMGIVEKLLSCKQSVSKTCQELNVSEIELQRWIKEYLQREIDKATAAASGAVIIREDAGHEAPEPVDWSPEENLGLVIESTAVRKPESPPST